MFCSRWDPEVVKLSKIQMFWKFSSKVGQNGSDKLNYALEGLCWALLGLARREMEKIKVEKRTQ